MDKKEMTYPADVNAEIIMAENSYRTLHKLIKSGMWKIYCNREF